MIIHQHDQLGSTNDEALRLAQTGAPNGTIVVARQQTAGRGRHGRRWISPPGNLHVSFLFRTAAFNAFTPAHAAQPGFAAALAVAQAIDPICPGCRLKWPNDVLLAGAKIAGILTEFTGDALIIGIGVNVAHTPPDMPYPVTSLAAHGATTPASTLLTSLIGTLQQRLADWDAHGFGAVRAAWLERGPAQGSPLTIQAGPHRIDGYFAGLDEDDALLLTTADGGRRVVAGEIVPVDTGGKSIHDKCPPLPAPVSRNTATPPSSPVRT